MVNTPADISGGRCRNGDIGAQLVFQIAKANSKLELLDFR